MRWVVYRLRGLPKESFRHVSAIPIIGSLIVALSLGRLYSIPAVKYIGIGLIIADSGGILWIIPGLFYMLFWGIKKKI